MGHRRLKLTWDRGLYCLDPIDSVDVAIRVLCGTMIDLPHEECYAIFCDENLLPLCYAQIGRGVSSLTLVNFMEAMQIAHFTNCAHVVIVHNHPVYSPRSTRPSPNDNIMVKELAGQLKTIGVNLYDSYIFALERRKDHDNYIPMYYSMRQEEVYLMEGAINHLKGRRRMGAKGFVWQSASKLVPEYWENGGFDEYRVREGESIEGYVLPLAEIKTDWSRMLFDDREVFSSGYRLKNNLARDIQANASDQLCVIYYSGDLRILAVGVIPLRTPLQSEKLDDVARDILLHCLEIGSVGYAILHVGSDEAPAKRKFTEQDLELASILSRHTGLNEQVFTGYYNFNMPKPGSGGGFVMKSMFFQKASLFRKTILIRLERTKAELRNKEPIAWGDEGSGSQAFWERRKKEGADFYVASTHEELRKIELELKG